MRREDWEKYWLSDNSEGIVQVHPAHALKVARILAKTFPQIIFLWSGTRWGMPTTICAILPNRRKMKDDLVEYITAAGEKIGQNVAAKHWLRPLFRWKIADGWCMGKTGSFSGCFTTFVRVIAITAIIATATVWILHPRGCNAAPQIRNLLHRSP